MQILNYLDRIIETSKNTEEDVGNFKRLDTPEVIFFFIYILTETIIPEMTIQIIDP